MCYFARFGMTCTVKRRENTDGGVLLLTLLKVTLFHGCFSRLLNCTNGTKTNKASQIQKKVMSQSWGNRVTAMRTERAEFIGPKKWSKSTVRPWFSVPKGTWTKFYSNIFPLYNALDVLRMYYVCLIWFECPLGFNVAFGKRTVVK